MKKVIALVLCLVLAFGVLAGCSGASNPFVGEWRYSDEYIAFWEESGAIDDQLKVQRNARIFINKDGNCVESYGANYDADAEGTYTIDMDEMTIDITYPTDAKYAMQLKYKLLEYEGRLFLVGFTAYELSLGSGYTTLQMQDISVLTKVH